MGNCANGNCGLMGMLQNVAHAGRTGQANTERPVESADHSQCSMVQNPIQVDPKVYTIIPRTEMLCEQDQEQTITYLLRPKFMRGPLAKLLQPRLRNPYMKIKLDQYGSFVWHQIDGQTTVEVIANRMKDHFGDSIEPAIQRVWLFIKQLRAQGAVSLYTE